MDEVADCGNIDITIVQGDSRCAARGTYWSWKDRHAHKSGCDEYGEDAPEEVVPKNTSL